MKWGVPQNVLYIYFPPTFLQVQFPHFNPRKCVTNATSIDNYNMTRDAKKACVRYETNDANP